MSRTRTYLSICLFVAIMILTQVRPGWAKQSLTIPGAKNVSEQLYTINTTVATTSNTVEWQEKIDVPVTKEWLVKLSLPVDPATVNDKSVYVTNPIGEKVQVRLFVSSEGKTITIKPSSSGYEPMKRYTLHVNTSVESNFGIPLSKPVEMKFTTQICNVEAVFTNYRITFKSALDAQMTKAPQIYKSGWVNASRAETDQYFNPNNYYSGAYKYQFLDLSSSNDISVDILKSYLDGRGILSGKENVFIEAANTCGVSEVYLIAHSCLETGNGTSQLATGVVYNGVRVYNMYGINAVDSDPVNQGAKKAYEMGWTTPELAIMGGAEWISKLYLNNASYKQNTLYKMRWNPMSPGSHQYATDVKWAVSQSNAIKKMFDHFPNAILKFDVPSYSDLTGPAINFSTNSLNSLETNTLEDIEPFKWLDINDDKLLISRGSS